MWTPLHRNLSITTQPKMRIRLRGKSTKWVIGGATAIAVLMSLKLLLTIVYVYHYNHHATQDTELHRILSETREPIMVADDSRYHPISPAHGQLTNSSNSRISSSISTIKLKPGAKANRFLITSYLHGGGGVLGELLNHHINSVFYLYQPFYKLDEDGIGSGSTVLNKYKSEEAVEWLQNAFNCSFSQQQNLIHEDYLWRSHSIRESYRANCEEKKVEMNQCLQSTCAKRSLRAAFIIRLGMDYINHTLKLYKEGLKILLVLRDPRAIISARRRNSFGTEYKTLKTFTSQASILCGRMAADLDMVKEMKRRFPGAAMVIRYEHLLQNPVKTINYLYNFFGLQVQRSSLAHVVDVMRLDRSEETLMNLTKLWQIELSLQESRAIDQGCSQAYKELGYNPVPDTLNAKTNYFISWAEARSKEDNHKTTKGRNP